MNFDHLKSNLSIKVYYEDTDAGGIIYHSKYLNFAERGRSEFLGERNLQQSKVYNKYKIRGSLNTNVQLINYFIAYM